VDKSDPTPHTHTGLTPHNVHTYTRTHVHTTQVPWNAALYAKDAVDYQKAAETEASIVESSEANELLDMAVEYNVLPPKKEKKFRRDLQTGDMKAATLVSNLQVLSRQLSVCLSRSLSLSLSLSRSECLFLSLSCLSLSAAASSHPPYLASFA
jgi:hypothetical protein